MDGGHRPADDDRRSSLVTVNGYRPTVKSDRCSLPLAIGGPRWSIVDRRLAMGDGCSWLVARGSFAMDARDPMLFARVGCSLLVVGGLLPLGRRSEEVGGLEMYW